MSEIQIRAVSTWILQRFQWLRQDRGLIWDAIADQLDAGKAADGEHLDLGLLHRWIAERTTAGEGGCAASSPADMEGGHLSCRLGVVRFEQGK